MLLPYRPQKRMQQPPIMDPMCGLTPDQLFPDADPEPAAASSAAAAVAAAAAASSNTSAHLNVDHVVQANTARRKRSRAQMESSSSSSPAPLDMPRAPLNAYMLFCQHRREHTISAPAAHSSSSSSSSSEAASGWRLQRKVVSEASQAWRECPPEERRRFEALAEEDRKRYERELEEYHRLHPERQVLQHVKKKRARSAFRLFVLDHRDSVEQQSRALSDSGRPLGKRALNKMLRETWDRIPAEERAPYEQMAKEEKREVRRRNALVERIVLHQETTKTAAEAAAAVEQLRSEEAHPEPMEVASAAAEAAAAAAAAVVEEKSAPAAPGVLDDMLRQSASAVSSLVHLDPPKNKRNVYALYCKEARPKLIAKHPDIHPDEVNRLLGQSWQALGAEERAVFQDMAARDAQRYNREFAAYLAMRKEESAGGATRPHRRKKRKATLRKDAVYMCPHCHTAIEGEQLKRVDGGDEDVDEEVDEGEDEEEEEEEDEDEEEDEEDDELDEESDSDGW